MCWARAIGQGSEAWQGLIRVEMNLKQWCLQQTRNCFDGVYDGAEYEAVLCRRDLGSPSFCRHVLGGVIANGPTALFRKASPLFLALAEAFRA